MSENAVDVSSSGRGAWVVKVPRSVAATWKPICAAALSGNAMEDDDAQAYNLGVVRIVEDSAPGSQKEATLTIPGPAGLAPTQYRMKALPLPDDSQQRLHVMSYQPAEGGGILPRVEGMVTHRFDLLLPIGTRAQTSEGRVQLDPKYEELARQRMEQASIRTRVAKKHEEDRNATIRNLGAARDAVKMQTVKTKVTQEQNKLKHAYAKMEKKDLESELYKLFQKQAHWHLKQLQLTTQQPPAWLKEVLSGIATMTKRGPMKDLWELNKDYKL